MSSPESVSSRTASVGSSTAIWKISLRFFSPPEKPSFTARVIRLSSMSSRFMRSRTSAMNSIASSSCFAAVLADRIERGLQEVGVVHARNLDRVLKRHEQALARARLRIHGEQILPLVLDRTRRDLVLGMPGEHAGERALAGTVRPHDGVHLAARQLTGRSRAGSRGRRRARAGSRSRESGYPTLPSSVMLSSFCASTANSIGSCRNTSLQKPLTIRFTASSVDMPRCRQ